MRNEDRVRGALLILFALAAIGPIPWAHAADPPQQVPTPPRAAKIPKVLETHGEKRVDDYFWMNDRNDPNVVAYLEAENAYAATVMEPTARLQARLYEEMAGRLKPDEESVPVEDNGYFYYTRYEQGKEYPLYCRRKGSRTAAEEVMLDVNVLAAGHKLYKTAGLTVSPDNRVLAFGVDTAGNLMYTIFFKDLAAGKMLPGRNPGHLCRGRLGRGQQDRLLHDATTRRCAPTGSCATSSGSRLPSDAVVFQEDDVRFEVSLRLSKSRKYVLVEHLERDLLRVQVPGLLEPAGRAQGLPGTDAGPALLGGARRREVLHPDRPRRTELPAHGGRPGEHRQGVLEAGGPVPAAASPGGVRRLQGLPRPRSSAPAACRACG